MTYEEIYAALKEKCLASKEKDPLVLAHALMAEPYIPIHGPQHHFLDGAAFLTAYHNNGGAVDLPKALDILAQRALTMPGAMCGYWGICGSVASLGASFSILHGVGPISNDAYYKDDMEFTSRAIHRMSEIGGPRCCKRNANLSISEAVAFAKEKYGVNIPCAITPCTFFSQNPTCLKEKCPFYPGAH